jgi:hypothetical protein
MADQPTDCEELRATIGTLQKEFEGLWVQVSSGATPTPRFRELRRELDQLRAQYASQCGESSETSDLPPHIMSDWRAG